jgi:hypothetical protein
MSPDEQLLLYREFRLFEGDIARVLQLSTSPDLNDPQQQWLDGKRAELEPEPTAATRPSSRPRCFDCWLHECVCPKCTVCQMPLQYCDGCDGDDQVGASANCHYVSVTEYERNMCQLLEKAAHGPIRLRPPVRPADTC